MSIPATMRALQQTSLNGPQDLRLITDAPVPSPGPGEVLIRVAAAGVNFVDISQARGTFAGGPQPPYLAGIEGAGEVTAIGEGVTALEPGAHVIGVGMGGGAFAEYMVLPAAAAVPVPTGWTDGQALGLVVNWPTVIATASPGKHAVVHALGADHVFDSRRGDLAAEVLRLTGGTGADLVLESVGGATLDASLAATKRVTGRVIVYGLAGGEATISNWELVYKHQVHLIGLNLGILIQAAPQTFGEVMGQLFELLAAGVLGPSQPTAYELAEGPKALAELEARATIGKLALLP
ncbi:zinc-binding dehydrogenase [Nonomuraea sp. NPDC050451]|uniref:zinc-binding dehydrogenase n=1 Tax=Nonomuraea sp. NPDC050451 TaxID=3364364 RepID=UPI00378B3BBE